MQKINFIVKSFVVVKEMKNYFTFKNPYKLSLFREKIKELLKNFRSEDFLVDEVQTDINFEKHQEHEKNWYFPGEYKSYQNRRNTQSEKFHPIYYDGWKSNLKRFQFSKLN